ncbi:hypothetical protein ES705_42092 [subsurface metagenome]
MRLEDHRNLWKYNETLINWLQSQKCTYTDWIIIITFYTALHKMDELIHQKYPDYDKRNETRRATGHAYRNKMVNKYYKSVHSKYDSLYRLSRKLRYEQRKLKAEIHFTYFQIIEALFELIFALENRKDKLLWFYISFSPYKKNFRRIGKVASGITDFLFKDVDLPFGKVIPLIQYIFYFGAFFPISDTDMKNNLEMIKRILILFAKDFSDRNEYNAYKHSLRFYHSPIWLEFGEILNGDKTKPILNMNAEDSFTFLCKNQDGNIDLRTKAFDPNRDYKMIALCHNLIQNVINLRKRSFFTPNEKAKACMFNKLDLISINKRKDTFIELKSTIFWKIDK